MIALCMLSAALAVWLLVPASPTSRIAARMFPAPIHETRTRHSWAAWTLAVGGAGLGCLIGYAAAGGAGAVVAASSAVALATGGRLVLARRARRTALRRRIEVTRGCAAIASQVRVGRVPGEALAAAAADWPVLGLADRARALGGDVPDTLLRQSRAPGCSGLADLARAWRLSSETGAPMAGVLDQVALALRRDESLHRTVAAELAGPRATAKVMAVLPVCGVGMGYLLGGRPIEFLLEGPLGWGCLLGGVVLASAGVLWVDRLARVAEDT
jgi:tight adherence protein B